MRVDTGKTFGTRECPSCACEVPANSNRCPICGYVFLRPSPAQRRLRLWGALIMLALITAMLVWRWL